MIARRGAGGSGETKLPRATERPARNGYGTGRPPARRRKALGRRGQPQRGATAVGRAEWWTADRSPPRSR
eukprot:6835135-Alexandrium_andersonii.AAC.1